MAVFRTAGLFSRPGYREGLKGCINEHINNFLYVGLRVSKSEFLSLRRRCRREEPHDNCIVSALFQSSP